MGGGGGKTSTSTTSSPYAGELFNMGRSIFHETNPVLKELAGQTGEALRTGGVGAQIPIIARSVDAARQGQSQSLEQARQNLARSGMGNSAFGQTLLSELGMHGNDTISQIPTNIAGQFIGNAGQVGLGGVQAAGGMVGNAMQGNMTTTSTPSFWDSFMQGLQGASTGAGAGVGAFLAG